MALSAEMQALIKGQKQKMARNAGKAKDLKEGKTRLRILPGWRDADPVFFHAFGLHWIKDETGKLQAVVGCYDHTYDQPCRFCDALDSAGKGTTDEKILKVIGDARSKKRMLVNAVERVKDQPDSVELYALPWSVFRDIVNIMDTYGEEYGNMTDLASGADFIIERAGKGMDTTYTVVPAPSSKPVDKAVMGKIINIDEYVKGEFESKAAKAINAIAHVTGTPPMISGAASHMLTGPRPTTPARPTVIENEPLAKVLDDHIPPTGGGTHAAGAAAAAPTTAPAVATAPAAVEPVAAAAAPAPSTPPADGFGKELGDEEIDKMLKELNLS